MANAPQVPRSDGLPVWKKLLFGTVTVVVLLGLIEGVLALVGVRPGVEEKDPFVGFVRSVPLFTERVSPDGQAVMTTAKNKLSIFNPQSFSRDKPDNTVRVFCLGGSTTYGRPYADATSFAGWLRAFLPVADPGRNWEVVNAGGISYASYRVSHLMEELVRYDPDLFIIYTGHNEFLEERTYRAIRSIPGPVRSIMGAAARTRIWTVLARLTDRSDSTGEADPRDRSVLPGEVQAKLDKSAGPALYERDDALRDGTLEHYRYTLERMVDLARSAGAEVILVTPASNLRDCTPFKSEPTGGLDERKASRVAELMESARSHLEGGDAAAAVADLAAAVDLDPRNPSVWYAYGSALLEADRTEEAAAAFVRARDEDVCALRALTPMQEAVRQVARDTGSIVVDFVRIVEEVTEARTGHPIAGRELFLDHVHPTIEGHRLLALALVDAFESNGILSRSAGWNDASIARITSDVEGSIDSTVHARALANLALTLDWAGKSEESQRLAFQALETGEVDSVILLIAGRHLAAEGRNDEARDLFRRASKESPNNPIIHSQYGMMLMGEKELEGATAHFFIASLLWSDNETYHKQLGTALATRNRPRLALASLLEAKRLSPDDPQLSSRAAALRGQLPAGTPDPGPARIASDRHPSGYPRTVAQTRDDGTGRFVLDGIWTEWYDGGALKAYAEYERGVAVGPVARWDVEGDRIGAP